MKVKRGQEEALHSDFNLASGFKDGGRRTEEEECTVKLNPLVREVLFGVVTILL